MIIFIVEEICYCPEGVVTGKNHYTFSNVESLEKCLRQPENYAKRSLIGCDLSQEAK
jgi:hypothetical protein